MDFPKPQNNFLISKRLGYACLPNKVEKIDLLAWAVTGLFVMAMFKSS